MPSKKPNGEGSNLASVQGVSQPPSVTLTPGQPVSGEPLKELYPIPLHFTNPEAAFAALAEPFEPEEVFWLPQSINYDDDNPTAVAAAYADKRAYSARMDAVLGKHNWQVSFGAPVVAPFTKIIKEKKNWKTKEVETPQQIIQGTKVFVVAQVSVFFGPGIGWIGKESTGAADTDDENAITTAEAQAFKRACSLWGPGNYFYELPKESYPYNKKKRTWKEGYAPSVPDWAIPKKTKTCKDPACGKEIQGVEYLDKQNQKQYISALGIINRARQHYQTELCADCQAARRKAAANPAAEQRLQ